MNETIESARDLLEEGKDMEVLDLIWKKLDELNSKVHELDKRLSVHIAKVMLVAGAIAALVSIVLGKLL